VSLEAAEEMPEEKMLEMRQAAARGLRAMYPLDDYWMEMCQGNAFDPFALADTLQSLIFGEAHEAFPEVAARQDLVDEFNSCFKWEGVSVKALGDIKAPSYNPFKKPFTLPDISGVVKPLREVLDPTVKVCKVLQTCTFKTFETLTLEKASPTVAKGMRDFVADIEFPEIPEELKQVLFDLLLSYFDKASVTIKLPMAVAYLQGLPAPLDMDVASPEFKELASQAMGNTLQGAGPFTHKMLQSTGDKVGAALQEILLAFKDSIAPMSHRELMHQVTAAGIHPKELEDVDGKFMVTIPDVGSGPSGNYFAPVKATASASIGQGHLLRGTVIASGAELVWLKVMRPFLDEKLSEEYRILDSITPAGSNTAKAMLEVKASVRNELDWEQEAHFMRRGFELYHDSEPGLRSVQIHQALPAEKPVVLVMEALGGSTLAGWISKPTQDAQEVCEAARMYGGAFRVWVKEALAGSGFFHGDPHAGNFMMDFSRGVEHGRLTFIDYGNSFEVEDPIAKLSLPFIMLIMGCLFDSPGLAVHAFEWQDIGMKDKAAQEIRQAWADFHVLEGSIGWLAKAKGLVAAWFDAFMSVFGVVVQKIPVALLGSALQGFSEKVHSWVALAPDDFADELQARVVKAFTVLFTYQHSMEFPPGLFGFSRALDLFTNSFKQMREQKGDQLQESGCLFHLQHPMIQIVNAFAHKGATQLVTSSYEETLAGSKKLMKDIISVTWK